MQACKDGTATAVPVLKCCFIQISFVILEWSCHRVLLVRSAHHLALAASALQLLKSGTLFLYLSVPVPVLIPSVVISRPTTASRPSNPLNHSPLAPQIRLLLTIMRVYDLSFIDLLTYYLLTALVLECNA